MLAYPLPCGVDYSTIKENIGGGVLELRASKVLLGQVSLDCLCSSAVFHTHICQGYPN